MLSSRTTKAFVLFLGLLFPLAVPVVAGRSPGSMVPLLRRSLVYSAMQIPPETVTASRRTASCGGGNANCTYHFDGDVPMSQGERQQVGIIRDIERQKGCQF